MNIFQAITLGLIHGITEFLPISSSAHLVLIPRILGWQEQPVAFDITLHFATLLALIFFFRKRIFKIIQRPAKNAKFILNLFIISLPTLIFGFFFEEFINNYFKSNYIIAAMLIIVGILLIFFALKNKTNQKSSSQINTLKNNISFKKSTIIGIAQAISLIRGTSRSGVTIIGGLLVGLEPTEAANFAFFAGIPVILAISFKQFLEFKLEGFGGLNHINLILASLASFISAILSIKFLIRHLGKRSLIFFGIYRILLGFIIYVIFL